MSASLDFGIVLALAYNAFVEEMRAELASRGHTDLHRSFGYVARALAERPHSLAELAAKLGISSPGAKKIVDEMEASGHLERAEDPDDHRQKRIRLTALGKATVAAARRFHQRFEARLAERVGEKKAAACRAVLESMIEDRAGEGAPPALRPV